MAERGFLTGNHKDKTPVRFLLHNGTKSSLSFHHTATFKEIKEKIWVKQNLPSSTMADYTFKLINADYYVYDEEAFQRALDLIPLFLEKPILKGKTRLMELECFPMNDMGDMQKLMKKMPTHGKIVAKGSMLRKENRIFWKKRHFFIQGHVMFCYENQAAFDNRAKKPSTPLLVIPVASCMAEATDDVQFGIKIVPGLKFGRVQEPHVFRCESKEERLRWLGVFEMMMMRRTKLICLNVCEALRKRGAISTKGIFKTPGDLTMIAALRSNYENGNFPDLSSVEDMHALCGLMRDALRSIQPLLTFLLYNSWLALADTSDKEFETERMKVLVQQLPPANRALLEYLLLFLQDVTKQSDKNHMDAANLAVYFSMLLRKEEGIAEHAAQRKAILVALITHANDIFPQKRYTENYHRRASVRPKPLSARNGPQMPPRERTAKVALHHFSSISSSVADCRSQYLDCCKSTSDELEQGRMKVNEGWNGVLASYSVPKCQSEEQKAGKEVSGTLRRALTKTTMDASAQYSALYQGLEQLATGIEQRIQAAEATEPTNKHARPPPMRPNSAELQRAQEEKVKLEKERQMVAQAAASAKIQRDPRVKGSVKVSFEHEGSAEEKELMIEEGDIIGVIDNLNYQQGWWIGIKADGSEGSFPSNYTEPCPGSEHLFGAS